MSEKKKALPNVNSELHTISPLPIETIAERITALTANGLSVQIEKLSEDKRLFTISHPQSSTTKLKGDFIRWNGTFTRLNCRPQSVRELGSMILPLILSLISLVILMFMLFSIDWGWWGLLGLLFLMIIFSPVLITLFLGASSIFWANKGDKKSQKLIDQMMQSLADKITKNQSEANLEFDGSELSLEMLLQDEKYKHFRLGADGEIASP